MENKKTDFFGFAPYYCLILQRKNGHETTSDPAMLSRCRENCKTAAQELTWENEEKVLEEVYGRFLPPS